MTSALIAALIAVESGGNDFAIGDGGRALGPLQIHRSVVADVNRLTGASFQWKRMTNRVEAVEVCKRYLAHYGKGCTDEQLARKWNGGGPAGDRKTATLAYWQRVKSKMKEIKQ